jgi:hypothetical protein
MSRSRSSIKLLSSSSTLAQLAAGCTALEEDEEEE